MMCNQLPAGWADTSLEHVANWGSGGTPSRKNSSFFIGNIPWIKTGELVSKYIRDSEEKISEEAIKQSSAKVFNAGSVGIAMYGATIGKLSIFAVDASTNQACAVATPIEGVLNNEFLYYYLLSERRALIDSGKGGAQPNISQGLLKGWPIFLPPPNEQKRIVAKIEELFSELDNGIAALNTAREQLKVYRQALLKHAFEGKLTAEWREENVDKLESPEQLIERTQQEREARYQQQLEEWKAAVKVWEVNGKEKKKPAKPKIPEHALLEDAKFEIPSCWATTKLGLITEVCGGLTKNQKRNTLPLKMKYLRVANVYADKLWLDDIQEVGVTEAEAVKVSLALNDLLVVEGNGSVEQIGRVALWDASIQECGHQNHLIRVRFDNPAYARFILLFLLSPTGRDLIVKEASSTSGLHTLSISKVSNLQIPLVSISEVGEIMKAVDEKLSLTSKFASEIEEEIKRAETLRQSILKKAFSGQLVPQDPSDEPVSELLTRVQAEREAARTKNNTKKTRKAK